MHGPDEAAARRRQRSVRLQSVRRAVGRPRSTCATDCDLVLPCRDEAAALPDLLARVPADFAVIVVDNGSHRRHRRGGGRGWGRPWCSSTGPGTARPCTPALLAATREYVAVMDGDGSFDPDDLLPAAGRRARGRADLAVGRRRPVRSRGLALARPRRQRLVVWWLRRRIGMAAHDIAPMRVCRRAGAARPRRARTGASATRSSCCRRRHGAGWRVQRARRRLPPAGRRAPARRCPARCAARVRARRATSARVLRDAGVLVVAKAPVPGRVKTRLGAEVGEAAAAELAAAALLDTLEAALCCGRAGPLPPRAGRRPRRWRPQCASSATRSPGGPSTRRRGDDFGERLAHAHAAVGPGPVVQVGMDTPQLTAGPARAVAGGLDDHDAVLAPAEDGGWWVLALRDPAAPGALRRRADVHPHDVRRHPRRARGRRPRVAGAEELTDVDTLADAQLVARAAPGTRFATIWARTTALSS